MNLDLCSLSINITNKLITKNGIIDDHLIQIRGVYASFHRGNSVTKAKFETVKDARYAQKSRRAEEQLLASHDLAAHSKFVH